MQTSTSAYNFFRANAGGVVGENALGAFSLAKAEREGIAAGLTLEWESDFCDCSFQDAKGEWYKPSDECEAAIVRNEAGEVLASLSGIHGATSEYRRVVRAELYSEALANMETRKPSAQELAQSLRETVRAFETHLPADPAACPCRTNELARAKALLARMEG